MAPRWRIASRETRFERGLTALLTFLRRHGHVRVPAGHWEGGVHLTRWVSAQRRLHGRGAQPKDRLKRLEAVPGWSWSPRESWFETSLAELRRYVRKHGHSRVPRDGPDASLALWVRRQRRLWKLGELSRDRVRVLEALPGWSWKARQDQLEPRVMRKTGE